MIDLLRTEGTFQNSSTVNLRHHWSREGLHSDTDIQEVHVQADEPSFATKYNQLNKQLAISNKYDDQISSTLPCP